MTRVKASTKIFQFWFGPLIIGMFFSLGYGISKRVFITNKTQTGDQINLLKDKRSSSKVNLQNTKIPNTANDTVKKNEVLRAKDKSNNGRASNLIKDEIKVDINDFKEREPAKKKTNQSDFLTIKEGEKDLLENFNSISLEAQKFFNNYEIDEIIKALPAP